MGQCVVQLEVLACQRLRLAAGPRLRHCPPQFGAIFNHGPDVVIIPELCSGCDKCLPACPVNCIYPFEDWEEKGSPAEWWLEPTGPNDPYL